MARKSDSRREKRISATEASRTFSRLLDEVEAGRRFRVHRRGHDVCEIVPPAVRVRRVSDCLDRLRARPPVLLDDLFGKDLLDVLAKEPAEARPKWES